MFLVFVHGALCYGGKGCSIKLWDPRASACLRTMTGHTKGVSSLCAHQGMLYSGSWDTTVRAWSAADIICRTTLEGHANDVSVVCSYRRFVCSGSGDQTIKAWDVSTGRCQTWEGRRGAVWALCAARFA